MSYNATARSVLAHLGTTGVIYEGKLGSDRKGRLEYENQAGDRSAVLWTRQTPPTQVFLESISFQARACLFVVPGGSVPHAITEEWSVPVLTVTTATFEEQLRPSVRSEFSEDSNAMPPVYIRLCGTGSMDCVQLVLSEKVIRYSFDVFATGAGCAQNAGAKSAGLTGVVEEKLDSPATTVIPINRTRPYGFSLFKQDRHEFGRLEGGQEMNEDAEEEEGGDDGVRHGARFGMQSGQWDSFLSFLQDHQTAYVSVRYAGAVSP